MSSRASAVAAVGLAASLSSGAAEYPTLLQYNVGVELNTLSRQLGRQATLDDIPNSYLDELARRGHDWFYALGIWQRSSAARAIAVAHPGVRESIRKSLPDFRDEDIGASPFAVPAYEIAPEFGGRPALARLRKRLHARGIKLMLDFVANHTAPDHLWAQTRPDFYVQGTEDDLRREPNNFVRMRTQSGSKIFAHGRDPNFDGWSDTLQLNYFNPALRTEMTRELADITRLADGVRCDMAMLLLPDVFRSTWARAAGNWPEYSDSDSFWSVAVADIKTRAPDFRLMAEAYWGREHDLQTQGFHWTYDKELYDRLKNGTVDGIRRHLQANLDFQTHSARFAENHDEPRVSVAFGDARAAAAQVITYFAPGLRFFHAGQREGRRVFLPMQLRRAPNEAIDAHAMEFHDRLVAVLNDPVVETGRASLPTVFQAWPGNASSANIVAQAYEGDGRVFVAITNYSDKASQARVQVPVQSIANQRLHLKDRLGTLDRIDSTDGIAQHGLYIDLPPWGSHVFEITGATSATIRSVQTARPDLGQYSFGAMAPLVVGDPAAPDSPTSRVAFRRFEAMLVEAKKHGVEAVSTDVWWGLVEPKDNDFRWDYYDRIADAVKKAGLRWVPILSFHQCGGNVGDDAHVPIPAFLASKYAALAPTAGRDAAFAKSEQRNVSHETLSVWTTRAALPDYADVMRSFQQHFAKHADNIAEINISLGPAGELRYPSYNSHDQGSGYPTRGALQAYSELAQQSFRNFAMGKYGGLPGINRAWGTTLTSIDEVRPPSDAEGFFARGDDKNIPYGRDFFDWYNASLVEHGKLLMSAAVNVFNAEGAAFAGVDIGGKVPGVHWRAGSDRTAELTAGMLRSSEVNTDWTKIEEGRGYDDIVRMFAETQALPNAPKIVLHFTCLEMNDGRGGDAVASRAKSQVGWLGAAATKYGVTIKGENALPIDSAQAWENIEQAIKQHNYRGFTALRLPLGPSNAEHVARLSRKYP